MVHSELILLLVQGIEQRRNSNWERRGHRVRRVGEYYLDAQAGDERANADSCA